MLYMQLSKEENIIHKVKSLFVQFERPAESTHGT